MKNVYIGKQSINRPLGIAICRVLDCDISTGTALVYNREIDKIEYVGWEEKLTLSNSVKKLAQDTEHEFEDRIKELTKNLVL